MSIYNFSAGPAVLPQDVLIEAAREMTDWHGSGMSVMEMSHRGREFMSIAADAEADLRELLVIPSNYKVLFLQGGGHSQFSMVPLNLLGDRKSIDFVVTGHWGKLALKEAHRFAEVNVAASGEDSQFTTIPPQSGWKRDPGAAYLHYVSNETIGGVQFPYIPESDVPLVCDMSSDFLSRPVDVSRFGLIFAGAQKNVGPAGLTLVIIREDLLGHVRPGTPTMFDYRVHADADSMYNTPPTYAIYMAGLVFKWLKAQGGLKGIAARNAEKAALLYQAIDASNGFYRCPVDKPYRSQMNVPFRLPSEALEAQFVESAAAAGLVQLKGHRSVGGMRASIYNAMPLEGVRTLVRFMNDFARNNG
ncbi:3-phosphoserine/phosphohydroxythreonine transaminase [Microvirgula aerodenitrificans]|uniref:3-phosphoserine/phosphohydroxythreonine transaminase n=1 Tax=Microvirgula aerodenitrificans TaxID=57480 RepID=UPI0028F0383F|nr:3-phosphoserine/phosphohydroxythreonine transaminase [Microvirgula aerodenitrificans]